MADSVAARPNRDVILEAAVAEVAEHGYQGASVRSVARRASVDPRLVRYYFPSKQDLVVAALLECCSDSLLTAPGDRPFARIWRDHPLEWAAFVGCGFTSEPQVRSTFVDILRRLAAPTAANDEEMPFDALLALGGVIGAWLYTERGAGTAELPERDIALANAQRRLVMLSSRPEADGTALSGNAERQ